jgi:putative addiction module killer protein
MTAIERTEQFAVWELKLKKKDLSAAARVAVRIQPLALGNPGDAKPVGEDVSELRIPYGPGYRVYYTAEGDLLILLLTGGAKPTQQDDINEAKRLARAWRKERT